MRDQALIRCLPFIGLLVACSMGAATNASAQKVRVTKLTDVNFGQITDLSTDRSIAQSLCLYSQTTRYQIAAYGSGLGNAFTLTNGADQLPYDVQWASNAGATSGSAMLPGTTLSGLTSTATHQFCQNGPSASASLIVRLRSMNLSSVTFGTYSGTLTLVVGVE